MIPFQKNTDITPFTTFGIPTRAKYFAPVKSLDHLQEVLDNKPKDYNKLLILGGGSNMLFTQDYDGLVLKNEIKGIELLAEDDNHYFVKIGAGENWHQFVLHAIDHQWAGIENLSLIPGNAGAAPMQNIGAYGVEIDQVLESVSAWHIEARELHVFSAKDCELGYRESIFKNKVKGQYIITDITLRLNKTPKLCTHYGAINSELERMEITTPTIRDISCAVIAIRQSKLPNPKEIGNAGSFFKNPIISLETYKKVKEKHPNLVAYPAGNDQMKIAAGWLIDQAGWKGKRINDYGVHANQALVLVNYDQAQGKDIFQLSEDIIEDVWSKYQIQLEREVNIIS